MVLKALISEQLDADGTLKTLKMQAGINQHIVVAFSHEYDEPKDGPFHFLDSEDEAKYREGFAQGRARLLSKRNFSKTGHLFQLRSLRWSGIPTESYSLSYYALSLPEFAIPERISIFDPNHPKHEYTRTVRRDDHRHRYEIYIECSSSGGRFDFELSCDFIVDADQFPHSEYSDSNTNEYGGQREALWRGLVETGQAEKVQKFLSEKTHKNNNPWISGSFYLVAFLCVTALLLVAAHVLNFMVFPLVIIGGIVVIGVIGAFQLRNDEKVGEKNFLQLMALSYRQIPFIGAKRRSE